MSVSKKDPSAVTGPFQTSKIACDRCKRLVEADGLENIAYDPPYAYCICGMCMIRISHRMKRDLLNSILDRMSKDL